MSEAGTYRCMRLLALLLIVVSLAGCASDSDPGDDAGDQLPDGSGGEGAPPDLGSQPAPGAAPQHGVGEDVDGPLHLVVKLSACEGGFCLNGTATNEGLEPYYVSDQGAPAQRETMTRDGEVVYPREPRAYIAIFSVREWSAGEDIEFSFLWDGMLWDDASDTMKPAPDGVYQWTALFDAYGSPSGDDKVTLAVTHTVVIGET